MIMGKGSCAPSQSPSPAAAAAICCMCGDHGLPRELFKCKICLVRSQHKYCSNLYPRATTPHAGDHDHHKIISVSSSDDNNAALQRSSFVSELDKPIKKQRAPEKAAEELSPKMGRVKRGFRVHLPLALKACAHLSAVDEGEQIHSMIVKSEFVPTNDVHVSTSLMRMYALCGRIDAARQLFDKMPNRNVVSWNTLLDGFVKSGDIDSAYEVFDAMPERNVVSWNSMIAGFVKNDLPREALMLFIEMMVCGLVPDEYTMASVISVISDLGLLDLGRRAHGIVY
uniref:PHD-type zinc finger plants domain-containing protein n=1 Tax=Ananas comosus var. bracteatus TaxID=296719 RepID=A0A6V7P6J9_ANACO|nr:unnamed protein product [Ananas comosus var. bracteatus]